jgi:hypothetical protein
VRIARIFNTYGPRMCLDDGRVVSNFVAQALRRQPMTVYGDGKQTRSFQYVSDLVSNKQYSYCAFCVCVYSLVTDVVHSFQVCSPGSILLQITCIL